VPTSAASYVPLSLRPSRAHPHRHRPHHSTAPVSDPGATRLAGFIADGILRAHSKASTSAELRPLLSVVQLDHQCWRRRESCTRAERTPAITGGGSSLRGESDRDVTELPEEIDRDPTGIF